MKKALKVLLILALGCALFIGGFYALFYFAWTTKLQKLKSPDRKHHAELIRTDGIDRNYTVRVNGTTVYRSPDFAPRSDLPFRETLVWDASSRFVILEVARHRIFGYDASTGQALTDSQLLALELPPDPPLWQYRFEHEWPGIGRALPPTLKLQRTSSARHGPCDQPPSPAWAAPCSSRR